MKTSKKFIALSAVIIGAVILVTSAFADIIMGSGYYSLKNAAKNTAGKLTSEVDNFTMEMMATVKIDDLVYCEEKSINKIDIFNEQEETISLNYSDGEINERNTYANKELSIHKDVETGAYNVYYHDRTQFNTEEQYLDNPFEYEEAQDAERVMDAFVGSLQDIIQVEEINNKKMYIGNLSDTQVPPLINAISSYFLKYEIFNQYSYMNNKSKIAVPKSNIYVLGASGKAIENEDGILESIIGSLRVSGTDESGNEHIYSVELSFEIKDINNTVVIKPDLEGKEVIYRKSGFMLDERHVGKYKNDIVIEKENSFEKVGERYFEIHSVEDSGLSGRYYEVYYEGYQPETVRDFNITPYVSEKHKDRYEVYFNYIDENGEQKTGVLQKERLQNLYINFNITMAGKDGYSSINFEDNFDNNFIRVFE
jgi:hypothetical protein